MVDSPSPAQRRFFLVGILVSVGAMVVDNLVYFGFIWRGA